MLCSDSTQPTMVINGEKYDNQKILLSPVALINVKPIVTVKYYTSFTRSIKYYAPSGRALTSPSVWCQALYHPIIPVQ